MRDSRRQLSLTALPRELWRLGEGVLVHAVLKFPGRLVGSMIARSALVPKDSAALLETLGETLIDLVDALGPLYGKSLQVILSRMGTEALPLINSLKLDRVYGDWPELGWSEVQDILDREIPIWRDELSISPRPLGVASMSQVHGATDIVGRKWVVKILKPHALRRLDESVTAVESVIAALEPIAVSRVFKRFLGDLRDLCDGLRREMNLEIERDTMLKVSELLASKTQTILRVPEIHPSLATPAVIVMERLEGVKLSDIVSGRVSIAEKTRKKLARQVLGELLVQIFEWGLFHGDPHGGNLMLLGDGSIGLYDWGLAGELLTEDRKFIAALLRSIMALDLEKLIDVLREFGLAIHGVDVSRETIRSELQKFIKTAQSSGNGDQSPSLAALIQSAMEGADRLGIPLPAGLLMMAKSLVTVEGLARGIDSEVPFARIAGPVLFRAAEPGLGDFLMVARKLPSLIGRYLRKGA